MFFTREKEEKEEKPVSDDEHLNKKEKAKKTIEGLKGDISISQEEEMSITGSNARFMIMQKLAMKDKEVGIRTPLAFVCPKRVFFKILWNARTANY